MRDKDRNRNEQTERRKRERDMKRPFSGFKDENYKWTYYFIALNFLISVGSLS